MLIFIECSFYQIEPPGALRLRPRMNSYRFTLPFTKLLDKFSYQRYKVTTLSVFLSDMFPSTMH
jgi:hypothetical protein